MSNDNTTAFDSEKLALDVYDKPEDFCFAVELFGDVPIVTICPIAYFKANGYLDDRYHGDVGDFLLKNGFTPVLGSSFEPDDEKMTIEGTVARLLELGFKQEPAFDKYIEETESGFSVENFLESGYEDDGYIDISSEDHDVEIEDNPPSS